MDSYPVKTQSREPESRSIYFTAYQWQKPMTMANSFTP